MNRFVHLGAISTLLWLLVITSANAQYLLKTGVQDFEARSNMNAFGLCGNMKALCGCVFAEGDSNNHFNEVKIDKKTTVENVLKEIIRKNPRYQWIIEDGVINILPKKEFRHLVNGKDQLDTLIKDLTITGEVWAAAPSFCEAAGLNCAYRSIAGIRELCNKISLRLNNVTLREALNKTIKADGMASWKLEYYGKDKQPIIDIHCWRPGRTLIEVKDTETLKIIMEAAQQQPVQPMAGETASPAASSYWYLLPLFIAGLLISYFIVRTFRAKIKPRG
ncbi:MAG: hypothetical protein HY796_04755 [Elusimicrobia bacterium]|nr:hypothetical protein [Elusimicrobiota bacterium]